MHGLLIAVGPAVIERQLDRAPARLDWTRSELLAVFPFPHRSSSRRRSARRPDLRDDPDAGQGGPVPVCFGFHPYVGLPGLRAGMAPRLPPMRSSCSIAPHPDQCGRGSPGSTPAWASGL